jgi:hypothetical protein
MSETGSGDDIEFSQIEQALQVGSFGLSKTKGMRHCTRLDTMTQASFQYNKSCLTLYV